MRFLSVRSGTAVTLCTLLLAGCGGIEKFPTAATTGTVLCEGSPVEYALVFFEPLQTGQSAMVGKQGVAITDAEGKFTISTYGDEDGAVVGKHRVRVGAPERSGWTCNCSTNAEFTLMEVDITADGTNDFELVLPKKKGRGSSGIDDPDQDEDEDED